MATISNTHLVLIPSYNTGTRVVDTVRKALEFWNPVWVVVDGSTDDTALVVSVGLGNTAVAGDSVQLNNGNTSVASAVTLSAANITAGHVDITTTTLTNATTYAFNAKITDVAGNVSAASANYNVSIDTAAPTVSSLALSATGAQGGTLNAGDVITVTANMSEAATVTGTPQMALVIGGNTVQANYASGTGSNALTFSYTSQMLFGVFNSNSFEIKYLTTR